MGSGEVSDVSIIRERISVVTNLPLAKAAGILPSTSGPHRSLTAPPCAVALAIRSRRSLRSSPRSGTTKGIAGRPTIPFESQKWDFPPVAGILPAPSGPGSVATSPSMAMCARYSLTPLLRVQVYVLKIEQGSSEGPTIPVQSQKWDLNP